MQFKRFTAALCAASIAFTQTAIVPISVSADNTAAYADTTAPQSFTDQYGFTLGVGNTSVSADASAKSVTLDGSEISDASSELKFFYGGSINSDFAFQEGDVFNFSVEGLTVTASKDQTTAVSEQTVTLGTYGQTYSSLENIFFDKDQCSKAIEGGRIIVNYSEILEDDYVLTPTLYILDADGNSIDSTGFNTSGDGSYFALTADIAASIKENGFTLVASDLTLNSVSLSVPAHDEQIQIETYADIGSDSWSITAENGALTTADKIITLTDSIFTDLADFRENGSVTAAWTSFTCSLERAEKEVGGIIINEENFPDKIFRNYVSDNFDTNKSGVLSDSEIAAVEKINVSSSGITNLKGIEYFTEIESLDFSYTHLSALDISKCTKLKGIYFTYATLPSLDISKNTELEVIDAHISNLSSLVTSNCTKLTNLNLGYTNLESIDISKNTALKSLDISHTQIKSVKFPKNTLLETIYVDNTNIKSLDLTECTKLKNLEIENTAIESLNLSNNPNLESLNISDTKIVALDLSAFKNFKSLTAYGTGRDITLTNNTFDLSAFAKYGLDVSKITHVNYAELNGSILTIDDDAGSASYCYDTGIENQSFLVTLNITKRVASDIVISYESDGTAKKVFCDTWNDVLKTVNNKNIDYTITLKSDIDIGNLTFPTNAKSVTLKSDGDAKTITTASSSVTLPTDFTLKNISIESTAKTFTVTANKNLAIDEFTSKSLTNLNGNANSALSILSVCSTMDFGINRFGTIRIFKDTVFNKTVNAGSFEFENESAIFISSNSVTVNNIVGNATICYINDYTPITINGNVKDGSISFYYCHDSNDGSYQFLSFTNGAAIAVSKTADLSAFTITAGNCPENSTIARVGSEIKIMAEAFRLTCSGKEVGTYAQWSDVLAAINDPTMDYTIKVLADTDFGGALTMPKAGTFKSLYIDGSYLTLSFTGNVVLTGKIHFLNIRLESYKKVGKERQPANFTITANGDITFENFYSDTLTAMKGGSRSTLEFVSMAQTVDWDITDFNTIGIIHDIIFNGTLKATNFILNAEAAYIGSDSVTFTNIINESDVGIISYIGENFKPITVTGNISAESDSKLMISSANKFSVGDTVLIAKAADLSKIEIEPDCLPDTEVNYTLTRVGSNVKVMAEAFRLSRSGKEVGTYAEWSDVTAAINDPTADYTIKILANADLGGAFTMPKAGTFRTLEINGGDNNNIKTLSFTGNVVLTGITSFYNIKLESYKKVGNVRQPANFTITANGDLDIFGNFDSKTLSEIKGSKKADLIMFLFGSADYDITGFNTVTIPASSNIELNGNINTSNLELYNSIKIGQGSVTAANIIYNSSATIKYSDAKFTPITVTGSITDDEAGSKLTIALYYSNDGTDAAYQKFSAGDTVLIAKTASLENISIKSDCLPDTEVNYTLARVGSNVKIMAEAFEVKVEYNGQTMTYAQWSDVLDLIAANAKAGNKDYDYYVTLVSDYDMNGAFKMPAANSCNWLSFKSENEAKTIKFTGNITLTNPTEFNKVNLVSQKKVKNEMQSVEFSINAGKNGLEIYNTDSKIKSITSSGTVVLFDAAVGTINANSVYIINSNSTGASLNSIYSLDPFAVLDSLAANADEWVGKDAPETNVNITGNLTVKKDLVILDSKLYVGGILNSNAIEAYNSTVVVNKQAAKGKYPLVIGKDGFMYGYVNFVLLDPETGKTAKITDETILGTISGPYADQLIPSNDNLEADDSYYIIKSGNKLIAKPKDTAGLVEVVINGITAHYKSLDDAIKDINAIGQAYDHIEIKLTQDMFKTPIAKLPLPNAGRYGELIYTADSNVTVSVTSDLTLTGNLTLNGNVALNKVDKSGSVLPISVNVGKYTLTVGSTLSAKTVTASEPDDGDSASPIRFTIKP